MHPFATYHYVPLISDNKKGCKQATSDIKLLHAGEALEIAESINSVSLSWTATHTPLHIRQVTYDDAETWCCVCFGGVSDLSLRVPDEENDAQSSLFSGSIALKDILGVEVKDNKSPALIVVRPKLLFALSTTLDTLEAPFDLYSLAVSAFHSAGSLRDARLPA